MDANGSGNGNGASSNGSRRNGKRPPEAPSQPRMLLQPFLLLALQQWQSHGYELIGRMSTFGFEALDRASVYRTLRQLEKDGLVVSGWDTSKDGPARRLYSLTDAGSDYLQMWAASLRGYQMMLNNFFTLYPAPARAEGTAPAPAADPRPTDEGGS
jgi:poly-beta-hydroxybutyrate-responsive repressor